MNVWELKPEHVGKFVRVVDGFDMLHAEGDPQAMYGVVQGGCTHFREQDSNRLLPFAHWDDVQVLEAPAE